MQAELERMIEHTRQSVASLQRIDVTLAPAYYDAPPTPGVNIEAHTGRPFVEGDRTRSQWGHWKVTTFPPEVCERFVLLLYYGPDDAG
jgi:hypothetical protein